MADKTTQMTTRDQPHPGRMQTMPAGPFSTLDRFADEMDRVFDDFGFGRGWLRPFGGMAVPRVSAGWTAWTPQVEVFHRDHDLVVRADLPGMNTHDVTVDVTDAALTISGERRQEHEENREGVYRSERRYGSFCRVIPLPEGAITDQAKASFKDGVLEVTMPAPPEQVTRGRRLEIGDASTSGSSSPSHKK